MIALRMAKELGLNEEQLAKVNLVLVDRFQYLEKSTLILSLSLQTADRKALQKLTSILNNGQYTRYQELRLKKNEDKEKYLKEHPGFAFSKEDLEMDF